MGILRGGRMRFAWLVTLVILAALALSNFMQSSMSTSTELSPAAAEGDFSNPKFATQDHVSEVTYLGTDYGGWAFDEKLVGSSPVVYSFGLGEDISWDAAMIEKYNVRLFGFDPTPKSEAFIITQMKENPIVRKNFVFVKEGLATEKGTLVFTKPANPNHVSMRMGVHKGEGLGETIKVLVSPLRDFMERFGHDHIDILKMDIEGAEYDVLEDLVAQDYLPFTQLLVEWHWRFQVPGERKRRRVLRVRGRPRPRRHRAAPNPPPTPRHEMLLAKLASKGFKVIDSRSGAQETSMIRLVNENSARRLRV
mmetsp:Transcript_4056/g.8365  ORF Transcript_4056/g.8365 Transcript_4056/m.8365 type:complete len:308 (+) Transcript_4056:248-1171(+)